MNDNVPENIGQTLLVGISVHKLLMDIFGRAKAARKDDVVLLLG